MARALNLLLILLMLAATTGCGQKGPLYFPESDDEREQEQRDDDR